MSSHLSRILHLIDMGVRHEPLFFPADTQDNAIVSTAGAAHTIRPMTIKCRWLCEKAKDRINECFTTITEVSDAAVFPDCHQGEGEDSVPRSLQCSRRPGRRQLCIDPAVGFCFALAAGINLGHGGKAKSVWIRTDQSILSGERGFR